VSPYRDGTVVLRVEAAWGTDWIVVSPDQNLRTVGDLTAAGRIAVVSEREGRPSYLFLADGTDLTWRGQRLHFDTPALEGHVVSKAENSFTVDRPLPAGEALRGRYVLVQAEDDGPWTGYEIESVEGPTLQIAHSLFPGGRRFRLPQMGFLRGKGNEGERGG
jgi:hypothetical protein